jgi:Na+/H+ antiporter NhaD/arsenite permease-like protein
MDALIVLVTTVLAYYFIIFSKKINKAIMTFFLATLLFVIKPVDGLDFENAGEIISFETLGILLGMMIIVEIMKETGFFTFIAVNVIKISRGKFWTVMFLLMIVVIFFSAFLDNLVTIILVAPIIFLIADTIKINPAPLMIFAIIVDNIGGMSTLIGSPLNIVLGSIGNLDFNRFLLVMLPISIISFVSSFFMFKSQNNFDVELFNKRLQSLMKMKPSKAIQNKNLMIKSVIIFSIVLAGFMLHTVIDIDLALIAMSGALLLMLLAGRDFEKMAKQIDWNTMFFYAGLFIITFSLEKIGVIEVISEVFMPLIDSPLLLMIVIMWLGSIITPFLSAVPGTLIMAPVVSLLVSNGAPYELWFAFAIGANLGTNLTPLGAVQNIVGLSLIEKQTGTSYGFTQYLKMTYKFVLIPMILGTGYLITFYYYFS